MCMVFVYLCNCNNSEKEVLLTNKNTEPEIMYIVQVYRDANAELRSEISLSESVACFNH